MADVRVDDALVTFGSKGGRPFAPGLPIGQVTSVEGTPGQLTRVATVRPFVDVSQLSIVGVVTRPPRVDPRDSVLAKQPSLEAVQPTPAPLGGAGDASPAASPSASPTTEVETAATPAADGKGKKKKAPQQETAATPAPEPSPSAGAQ
jgi:rod shape-determining protein MreC